MTITTILIGLAIGFLIAYFLFNNTTDKSEMTNNALNPEEINEVIKKLSDDNSEYHIFKPGTKLKRRYESIMDFVLQNLNSETKKIVLEDPVNFDTAIAIITIGEIDRNPNFNSTPEWIAKQRKRIQNEESYEFPELGVKKCPPPNGGGQEAFKVESFKAPWWTWFLNKYINILHNYDVKIIGEINDNRLISPSIENREFTQFNKPEDLGDDGVQFALIITLTNIKTNHEIHFKYYLAFKD